MKKFTMKTLRKPLVVVSALITVTLLLSWKYFDTDGNQSIVSSSSFLEADNELSNDDLLTFLAQDGAGPAEFEGTPAAEDVLVQRIPGDNNHMLMMAYYSKENYSGPSFTVNNGSMLTFRD